MINKILNFLRIVSIFILLFLISFVPQPLHQKYESGIIIFLSIFLLILFLNKRGKKNISSLSDWPAWLFLICMSAGTVCAINKIVAIETFWRLGMTFFLIFYIGKRLIFFEKDWNLFGITISLFSGCVALIAILELYFGRNILYENFIPNFCYERYVALNPRPMSTQLNPAILGTYLTCCLPFNFYQLKNNSIYKRWWGIISTTLSLAVIILTFSRGVLLGFIALLLFYLWHLKKRRLISFFLIFLLVFMTICSFSQDANLCRFGFCEMICGGYASIFSDYRFQRLFMAFGMLKEHPFFGIGLTHFRIRFYDYYPGINNAMPYEFMIADNMYLTILAETGLIGTIGFLIFIIRLLSKGLKQLQLLKVDREKLKLLVPFSALVGLLVNMGAFDLFFWAGPYMLFCLMCGFMKGFSTPCDG